VLLEPGDILDRYVIEACLGAGGMGEVYRARDTRLQRSVALKILHEEADPEKPVSGGRPSTGGAARMLREARAAAALDHPNVVAVFDVGQIEAPGKLQGATYLAMELIKGSSLRHYVRDPRVPMDERVRWLIDIARALAAAHREALVHRDIKPENVMIRNDGQVKVLDFGIARRTHGHFDATKSTEEAIAATTGDGSAAVGTPLYMAPEQLRAEPLDGRADQFGWGIVAYELLSGAPPWSRNGGSVALLAQILSKPPRPLEEVAPSVPPHIAAAVTRALKKDREERFPSMDALIEAMGGQAETRATLPPPLGGPPDPLAPTLRVPSATPARVPPPRNSEVETQPATSQTPLLPPLPPAAKPRRRARLAIAGSVLALSGALVAATVGSWTRAPSVMPLADGAASAPMAKAECTSNRACIAAHSGEPWICRAADNTCVSLKSEDCSVLAEPGDVELDSTVWIGMMLPLTGELANGFKPAYQAADLARRDFAGTTGVVGSARRIAVVACDGDRDRNRAARHLADDLRVPAVLLGLVGTDNLVGLISNVFEPANVLTMLPHSASPSVTSLPQGPAGRLVWRSTFNTEQLVDTEAALIEQEIEPQWKRKTAGRTTRVAYLHRKDVLLRVLSDHLLSVLRFNGKSVVENGDDFREIAFGEGEEAYAAARAEVLDFRPSILIEVSGNDFRGLIRPLEEEWPPGAPRPTYVLPYSPYPETWSFIAADAERRRRFFGMDTVAETIANADFVNHYNETFGDKVTRVTAPNNIYDGFYALAYAIQALGSAPATGPSMADELGRLDGPGKTFTVGPHAIFDAFAALRSGASIDLEGAAGHLDLDPTTGESTFDIAILCVAPPDHGAGAHVVGSGLVYSQRDRRFTGKLACP
jgi:serine/threonine protein kinase/ABC-type branched-subunit amino acid transport system substrate-binding protein